MTFSLERSFAEQQDRADPLAKLRDEFLIPRRADGSEQVYLCGHSLGLQPKAVGRFRSGGAGQLGAARASRVTSNRSAHG